MFHSALLSDDEHSSSVPRPSLCLPAAVTANGFCLMIHHRAAQHSQLGLSESHLWAREVSSGRVIQGLSQQLLPEDRYEALSHGLLLLLGAMVLQRQNHWVGRHLPVRIIARKYVKMMM